MRYNKRIEAEIYQRITSNLVLGGNQLLAVKLKVEQNDKIMH